MKNVYHIPLKELLYLIKEYRTCTMEDGHETRLDNSKLLSEMFISKGYDAVITVSYEDPTTMELCVFRS